ncbi:WhiB family transcriptional regulator [Cellulomonas endophytica]|uniref:WhiB family transcriptional regulator n=1 Tax=Cellulomonas endophytica TaxID=2494735 RepID=UPI0023EA775F|nr:WhiB family transcriptional regulator [Cellulomonas endophytica]
MRLTTLLDTASHTGSGRWPLSVTPSVADTRPTALQTGAAPTDPRTSTLDERREFTSVVAGLIPCRSNDAELWFAERTADVEQAKALCRDCPLLEGCLAGALERAEPWGVWGGQVFVDGVVVATKRGRGRPRKTAQPAA